MTFIKHIPIVRTLIRNYELFAFRKHWRNMNKDNRTVANFIFPTGIVSVGKYTYGMLNIYSYYPQSERLNIGNFVSIAPDVKFILGGNHQINTFSSYPFSSFFEGKHTPEDAISRGPIIIEDEVWIGINAIILSGVKIGKGAIIGAGAVVAKSIPPYAIVIGNPCQIIKYRFSTEIIARLMNINLIDYPKETLKKNTNSLYNKLKSQEDIDNLLTLLKD